MEESFCLLNVTWGIYTSSSINNGRETTDLHSCSIQLQRRLYDLYNNIIGQRDIFH